MAYSKELTLCLQEYDNTIKGKDFSLLSAMVETQPSIHTKAIYFVYKNDIMSRHLLTLEEYKIFLEYHKSFILPPTKEETNGNNNTQ